MQKKMGGTYQKKKENVVARFNSGQQSAIDWKTYMFLVDMCLFRRKGKLGFQYWYIFLKIENFSLIFHLENFT